MLYLISFFVVVGPVAVPCVVLLVVESSSKEKPSKNSSIKSQLEWHGREAAAHDDAEAPLPEAPEIKLSLRPQQHDALLVERG